MNPLSSKMIIFGLFNVFQVVLVTENIKNSSKPEFEQLSGENFKPQKRFLTIPSELFST